MSLLYRPNWAFTVSSISVLSLLLLVAPAAGQSHVAVQTNSSGNFADLSSKADAARDAERLDEAISLYHRALKVRPSWAEGWWSLGTIYYDRDACDRAAMAFQHLVKVAPKNGTGYVMLGLCQFQLNQDGAALASIQTGLAFGLLKDEALRKVVLFHEGILLQRKGRFRSAQDTLEELCQRVGPSDDIANILGMTMLRLTQRDLPPPESADGRVVLRVGRAECLAGQKKYDDARQSYEEVVKENPNYPNIHYAYGLFRLELPDVAGGVEQLKQEISNHPDNGIARLWIAAAYYKQNSADGIPYAEEAVKMDPAQPFGHYLLGLLRLDVDDYLHAIPELEIAQKGLPQEAKIYLALGTAYSRAGRKAEAAQARASFARLTEEQKRKSEADGKLEPQPSPKGKVPLGEMPTVTP